MKTLKLTIVAIACFASVLNACAKELELETEKKKGYKIEATKNPLGPDWVHNQPIYEIRVDRASPEGTFKGLEKQIPLLKELGVGVLWIQPVHQRGAFRVNKTYLDSLGGCEIPVPEKYREYGNTTSPYNINDHYSVNPNYGTPQDLKDLVKVIHENGMYVILDFVINHTSWGHVFTEKHPEFYKRNEKGAVKYTAPWKDIAQLDYSNKELWNYMDKLLKHWIDEYDIDGFRTDVADRIPAEFWNWVKPRISKNKDIFMLAEGHLPQVYPSHSMTYDWNLAPAFWSVVHGKRDASAITNLLKHEIEHFPEGFRTMRHATNHDTQGPGYAWPSMTKYFDQTFDREWYSSVKLMDKFGGALEAYMVLCATLPNGQPMIWTGQEFGVIQKTPKKIPFGEKPMLPFYKDLFDLYRNNPVLVNGDFEEIPIPGNPSCYCFKRQSEDGEITVITNLSKEKFTIWATELQVKKGALDFFGKEKLAEQVISVEPGGYKVFIENIKS